jgi:hypothetical protein
VRIKLVLSTLYSLALVPVVALLVAWGLSEYQTAALRGQLRDAVPTMTAEELERFDNVSVCAREEVRRAIPDVCYHTAVLEGIGYGARVVLLVDVLLIGFILLFLRLVHGKPQAIARYLQVAVLFVALVFAVLVFGNALLILSTVFALSATFVSSMSLKVLIAIAAVGGVFRSISPLPKVRSVLLSARSESEPTEYEGILLQPSDAPRLHAQVTKAATRVGASPPDNVVVGAAPGITVDIGDATLKGARLRGRTLYMSLPTCRSLTEREFEALVAAELLCVKMGSGTTVVCQPLSTLANGFRTLVEANVLIKNLLVLPPAVGVFGLLFVGLDADLIPVLSRDVMGADAEAARIYGVSTLATALVKEHLHVIAWISVVQVQFNGLEGSDAWDDNVSLALSAAAERNAKRIPMKNPRGGPSTVEILEELDLKGGTFTTPKLGLRLRNIGAAVVQAAESSGKRPIRSAATLVPSVQAVEEELTRHVQRKLAEYRWVDGIKASM